MEYSDVPAFLANLRENWAKLFREFRHARSRLFGYGRVTELVVDGRGDLAEIALKYHYRCMTAGSSVPDSNSESSTAALPLIVDDGWMPISLIRSDDIRLLFDPQPAPIRVLDTQMMSRLVKEIGLEITDNTTYRLINIVNKNGSLELHFALGLYSDYLNSCEVLTWELALAVGLSRRKVSSANDQLTLQVEQISQRVPLRSTIAPFDLSNRSAAAGINTLTVLAHADPSRNVFLLHQRRRDLAEAAGMTHCVPAGMFQPLNQSNAFHAVEFSLRRNVLREFGEELMNKEQLISERGAVNPDDPYTLDRELAALKELFEIGGADLRFLGIGLDPVTLKPEILTLLIINDDLRASKGIQYRPNWEGKYEPIAFSREAIEHALQGRKLTPAGFACLRRTLDLFDEVQEVVLQIA